MITSLTVRSPVVVVSLIRSVATDPAVVIPVTVAPSIVTALTVAPSASVRKIFPLVVVFAARFVAVVFTAVAAPVAPIPVSAVSDTLLPVICLFAEPCRI